MNLNAKQIILYVKGNQVTKVMKCDGRDQQCIFIPFKQRKMLTSSS